MPPLRSLRRWRFPQSRFDLGLSDLLDRAWIGCVYYLAGGALHPKALAPTSGTNLVAHEPDEEDPDLDVPFRARRRSPNGVPRHGRSLSHGAPTPPVIPYDAATVMRLEEDSLLAVATRAAAMTG